MAYDKKFRLRVIKYKDAGHTFKEVYEAFGVYSNRYYAWKKQLAQTGSLEYHTAKEHKGKIDKATLIELSREHSGWFLREYAAYFNVREQAERKMFVKLGITRKKKTFTYSQKSAEKREEYLKKIECIPAEKRVYIDECGIKERLVREHGRAFRGVKVEDTKRGRKFNRINVVDSQTQENNETYKIAPMCYQKSMNSGRFEEWVKHNLLPAVKKGSTIIMDNDRFHRKKELEKIMGQAEVHLLFLPPYSPDLNPIEKLWANMKRNLRDTAPLYDLLQTAIYNYLC